MRAKKCIQLFSSRSKVSGRRARARGSFLDQLGDVRRMDDALHEDAGRVDGVGVDFAGGHEVFDLGDGEARGSPSSD